MHEADNGPIQYFAPDADLIEMISTVYIARFPVAHFDEMERADRPQLRLRLNDSAGEYHLPCGTVFPACGATIIGPTSGPVRAVCYGPVYLAGFGLMPSGWATLMGPDAEQYADRVVDAHDLFGGWIDSVAAQVAAAPSDADRVALLQDLAREILRRGDPAPLWFTRTVDAWLASHVSPQVPDLVTATGMSARSVERMTKRYYGVTPKMLARKYRALRAASALARGARLDEVALGEAFYDQSHLIREVKQFTGTTPGKLSRISDYTRATTVGRYHLTGQVSPLITDT
jgi:AraC-like DNA-binding protein